MLGTSPLKGLSVDAKGDNASHAAQQTQEVVKFAAVTLVAADTIAATIAQGSLLGSAARSIKAEAKP